MRKELRPSLALGLATLTALLLAPAAAAASGAAAVASTYQAAEAGTASVATAASPASQFAAQPPARGARSIPRGPSTTAPSAHAPQATPSALNAAPPSLLESFNGVSSLDSAITNFGAQFEPPDQGLCVGNGYVVEMVNSAYTVYRPNGAVVAGPFNINGPFNEGLIEFTSDPRCHFDAATHTWFATILFINSSSTASHLDIAVNTSGDPTKPWTDYRIDTSGLGGKSGPKHPECPCFGDQPTLGIDQNNLYVTTNDFSIVGPAFYGAQIYAIAKPDLVSLNPTVHFVRFPGLHIGGGLAASVQPALSSGSPPAEFFLNSLDPTETFDQRIGVWAMTNTAAVASGGKPVLSSLVVQSQAYGKPPRAEQKGTSSLLESNDDRMQQVQSIGASVWGALDTALTIPSDPVQRAGAAWFQVRPALAYGGVIAGAQIKRQGYVSVLGNYLLFPALAVAPGGTAAMVTTLSGSTRFPTAAYALLAPGAKSFGPLNIGAVGSTHYDPAATRWGDYSWAVPDPSGKSVWLATEYMPPKSSQTNDGVRDWGTRVLQVAAGG